MCFLCLQNDPFDVVKTYIAYGRSYGGKNGKIQAEAIGIKRVLKDIEENQKTEDLCGSGDDTVQKLKERQYEIVKLL